MKKLILIPILLFCVTAFGQWTKPQLYDNINTNIRLKTYSPTRISAVLDSIVATMGTGSSFTLINGNGTTVNGTGDGIDWGGAVTADVLHDFGTHYYYANNISSFSLFTPTSESLVWDGVDFLAEVASGASFRLGATGAEITGDVSVGATGEKVGFLGTAPVVKYSAVTTPQGVADALTAYGLLPSSTLAQYWPSSGSFSLTGNLDVTGTSRLRFGGFGAFLNGYEVYSDANIILSGGSSSSVKYTLNPGVRHLFDGGVRMDDLATGGANEIVIADTNGDLGTATIDGVLPSQTGNNGKVLQTDGSNASWQTPSGGSGLTVGTSTITSGTNTRVLYNNSGVLGEYTVSGSGNVAMTTSPVFTTPNIGTATGTASGNYSLASGGTATGTNTFAMGSNPFILTSGVTTGTGATAGIQNVFNSLTTGIGNDKSSSSATTGFIQKITSTSTVINHTVGTHGLFVIQSSGANSTSAKNVVGLNLSVTNTGTTSKNYPLVINSSGATTNYGFVIPSAGTLNGIGTSAPAVALDIVESNVDGVSMRITNNGASGSFPISIFSHGGSTAYGITAWQNSSIFEGQGTGGFFVGAYAGDMKLSTGSSRLIRMKISNSNGDIIIAPSTTTTTPAAKLHVQGNGTTTGYNFITGDSGGTARLAARDNGAIEFSGSAGTAGYYLTSAGASSPPTWTAPSNTFNGLLAATGTNTIDNTSYAQTWNWTTLAGVGLTLQSTSTTAASNSQVLASFGLAGTNANASQQTITGRFTNTHAGTGAINYALSAAASGGASNYSIWASDGDIKLAGSGGVVNIEFETTTGTKLGTSTSQKFAFWNTTPIVQPTTGIAAATFTANTSLIANDTATFDGYTIGQVVKALRNLGILQ